MSDLADIYRNYFACLNARAWSRLGDFVHDDAQRNSKRFGLAGYVAMLEQDFEDIPDLHFNVQLLICDPPRIAARLFFNCTPKGIFLGLPVNGKRVSFTENVFYEFREGKICSVWSVIDKAAIEGQIL